MRTHVAKWGSSCAIRIPKMAVETLGLHAGQSISITIQDNKLILKKEALQYKLDDLVAHMHQHHQPNLMLDDDAQGGEIL